MNLYVYVGNDPVSDIDITGSAMVSLRIEDDVVTMPEVIDDGDKYHTSLAINRTNEFRNSRTRDVTIEKNGVTLPSIKNRRAA